MSPSVGIATEAPRVVLHFMSDKELSRVEILRDLAGGVITTSVAAQLLDLDRRQVQRLFKAYQQQGVTALISKKSVVGRAIGGRRRTSRRRPLTAVDRPTPVFHPSLNSGEVRLRARGRRSGVGRGPDFSSRPSADVQLGADTRRNWSAEAVPIKRNCGSRSENETVNISR